MKLISQKKKDTLQIQLVGPLDSKACFIFEWLKSGLENAQFQKQARDKSL
jgi:hypothetical protein